ncbi:MAG: hypothetical protein KKH92_09960 [Firmicutes bacterium]|nr:hypothetical protein [Bacillota bacterium]
MKSTNLLVGIILDILDVNHKNRPNLSIGERTFYNSTSNTIYLGTFKLPKAFEDLAHESMHCLQKSENRLGFYTPQDRAKYAGNTEGMFFKYDFEREAQAFGWFFAGRILDLLYSEVEKTKEIYEQNRILYSKMTQLVANDVVTLEDQNSIQKLLDIEYERIKKKYSERMNLFAQELIDWKE